MTTELGFHPGEDESKKTEPEKHFEDPLVVETEDGDLEIYEVNPKEKESETPVLISPGFTQGPDTLKGNMLKMGEMGRHIILPSLPHGNPSSVRDEHIYGESEYQTGKAATHKKTLETKSIEKTDAVGHSEGCINLILAAAMYPERFRNLVLVNPAGLVGKDNVVFTGIRFLKNLLTDKKRAKQNEQIRDNKAHGQTERDKNFWEDLKQTYESAISISSTRLEELLAVVKSKGIKVSIIYTKGDQIFPANRIEKMNERYREGLHLEDLSEAETEAEMFDNFSKQKGEHNDFYLDPEKYAEIILKELEKLEEIK